MLRSPCRVLSLIIVVCLAWPGVAEAASIWVEGEDATRHKVNRHPWYDKVNKEELSGGEWLCHFSDDAAGEARFVIDVPEAGAYTLFVRANPVKAKLSVRVGDGEWQAVALDEATDQRNIAADGKPDLRFIAWVRVGEFELKRGKLDVDFRMDSENHHHGGIDCFVLTTEPFEPIGTSREGAAIAGETDDQTWPFEPQRDPFNDAALLDLRFLNEKAAGEHGFVRLAEDGMSFIRGDGEPIRFWSVCSYGYRLPPDDMDHHARLLAKLGVNMVRLHTNIAGTKEGQTIDEVDQAKIDQIYRFIKACKDNGIYLTISPYWYHHKMPASWEKDLAGWQAGDMPTGSLFFNERFQQAYKRWVRVFYTTKNPHTGLAIKDDPAVAILQVKNEDSLLFYTANNLPRPQQRLLSEKFAQWLIEKHGSLDAAFKAWDGTRIGEGSQRVVAGLGDAPGDGVVGMLGPWELTQPRKGGMQKRIADQLQFTAELQRGFYAEIDRYLREDLGCRQLTNAMNWKSADKLTLDDVERWTYTGTDIVAVNRYAGGRHEGKNRGYRIDPGHTIVNRSLLHHPLELPTNLKQVAEHPMLITESTWVNPNLYQSEGPMLAAAYLSLTGVDALYWFAHGEADWLRDARRKWWHVVPGNDRGYAIDKWSAAIPMIQGMFPANALTYRLGYIRPAEPVVRERRSFDELWQRKPPIIAETETFDPNRDLVDRRGEASDAQVSRLAFLVGPVHLDFAQEAGTDHVADLSPYIDPQRSTVRSATGELALDWQQGLFTIDTPKAQGVGGFLKDAGGRFELTDLVIESENEYATVQVVALDDRPIGESGKLLVQVGTTNRLTGWTTTPLDEDGPEPKRKIVLTGKPPYRIEHTQARLTLANPGITRATRLDPHGYPTQDVAITRQGDRVTLTLPPNTLYLVLR
jgi:hypothetical protein